MHIIIAYTIFFCVTSYQLSLFTDYEDETNLSVLLYNIFLQLKCYNIIHQCFVEC